MTKVKVELECLKDLLKREPIVKVVNELPDKATADLNYIYVVPKNGEGKDTKAYVLRPDRSGYDAIDLTPQLVNVVGEGYITVEKETLNENGDVTFTVSTSPSLKALLDSLTAKDNELEAKVTSLEDKEDKDTIYNDTEVKQGIKANESAIKGVEDDLTAFRTHTDSRLEALENKEDKDTIYDDSDLKEQVNDLGSSVASALHDISEIRVNNESRLSALEKKPDNDKQALSLEGNTLSISNGNSVDLPQSKPIKVSSTSEGVTVTPEEEDGTTNYKVNIDDALSKYYDKSKTYTKQEVDSLIVKQEEKATDITVYRGTFPNRDKVKEGSLDIPKSPRATLTYSSSTGVGIARVDFIIVSDVAKNTPIVELPADAPTPAELIEAQAWVGDVFTSIWIGKGERVIRMVNTNDPRIFNKRIILNIPGIFKK